uniref:Phytocyanin domain-containing protein n=1 Tax=Daucus carota subsp. sativus TaxID=79200 RepID=A0A164Y2H4_DAUCS
MDDKFIGLVNRARFLIIKGDDMSFSAGGKDGWILSPSETYDAWSKRQRFVIGDSITFKYTQGVDSVLAVNKNDYDTCNVNNPITKMEDGNSVFKLDKAGPFYFISGNKSNCDQGQKLNLVVISPKNHHTATSPVASPPAPTAMTPLSPVATSPVASPPAPTAMTPLSPEIPAMPAPTVSAEAPMSGPGTGPVAAASTPSGAPPPTSVAAAKLTPSIAAVASIWFVTSVALGSFVMTH